MLRTILAGMRARTARLVLSSVAIALGVAFVTGTLVLSDAMTASMNDGFAKTARNVDASVTLQTDGKPSSDKPETLSEDTLAAVRKAPGVAAADGRTGGSAPFLNSNGKAQSGSAIALESEPKLRPYDVVDGRFPQQDNEIALEKHAASNAKLTVGQQVTVLGKDDQKHSFTLVGTYQQGANTYGTELLLPQALRSLGQDGSAGYHEIVAMAAPGVSQQQLVDHIKTAVQGQKVKVITGADLTTERLKAVSSRAANFTTFLLAFAIIALVVASMVIYNTFTILIAQRTKELALLRCVGAGRGQVFGSVLAEALLMGLIASTIGLFGGLGVSALLQLGIGSLNDNGSDTPVTTPLSLSTVLAAFAVGTVVTVLAAVLPARKATKVAPIAALRTQTDSSEEVSRTGKVRMVLALLVAAVGGAAVALGLKQGDGGASSAVITSAGAMLLTLAVVMLGPLLVGPINRVLGAVPRALFGVPAKLAAANAGRNPKRTAATTAALLIGVTIVSLITVVATSAKDTVAKQLDQQFPADYWVTSALYDHKLPTSVGDKLAGVSALSKVAASTSVYAQIGTEDYREIATVPANSLGDLVRPTLTSGRLDKLGPGELALGQKTAETIGAHVGDTVPVAALGSNGKGTSAGPKQSFKVVAIFSGQSLGNALIAPESLAALDPQAKGYDNILLKVKPGVSLAEGRAAVDQATADSPIAKVESPSDSKDEINTQVNNVLAFIWAMIGLAVVIALVGIANTLSLSVLERTRESALLRALGLTRGQLRLMLVVESILMALMGAVLGLILGVGSGWLLTKSLSTAAMQVDLSVPVGQIGVLLVAAVIAAVLAAALPARRAARTSVVAGMAEA
ncbi:FtsX-like permease family protein [Solihabitans fulvus]|uniref:FtsX-like permease family protein n=1 Tax=Solihabitans fulvus TaxID=1892852 RepID=A0A5B2X6D7_9PSEU|nr:FtsX-like permease family protein [Solihabitans fulvus]KAA2258776.1 FtsX-like permease family protein [Solihabitans fulvus]